MTVSSVLVTAVAGSTVNIYNRPLACTISSSSSKQIDNGKLGFISCEALGNITLSTGRARRLQRVQSPGVARCEASEEKGNSLDIWLGRAAMLGFVGVVSVEVATGKGVLENAGLVTPLPTPALVLTAVVGVITAFGIFTSVNSES